MRLAIFDLDYTLTKRGTWGRFVLGSIKGQPWRLPGLLLSALIMQARYKAGRVPRIRVKQAMMARSIVGRSRKDIEQMAEDFARAEYETGLRPPVLDALRAHQAAGDTVLIASAAVDILVSRLAEHLNVDGFVATDMAWDDNNRLASQFGSKNCYGEEKLERVRNWIETNMDGQPEHVIAYSDSRSDAPILEYADRAIIVAPNSKTRRYAERHGFQIWEK